MAEISCPGEDLKAIVNYFRDEAWGIVPQKPTRITPESALKYITEHMKRDFTARKADSYDDVQRHVNECSNCRGKYLQGIDWEADFVMSWALEMAQSKKAGLKMVAKEILDKGYEGVRRELDVLDLIL